MNGEWQPIESAPKDGTWVLLYHKYARVGDWYWDGGVWTNDSLIWHETGDDTPTHWQPLPQPPEQL